MVSISEKLVVLIRPESDPLTALVPIKHIEVQNEKHKVTFTLTI
ncbi:hypothetical protein ACJIZ3_008290 [Penstemon smallii]|uniref:Uncharacterized protein n=1 Tax=Penstemon smallii TaxID=265156 RepID=A0ABD3T9F0_9LAMI